REQQLATAFNRLHPQKVEGGSVPEEFRVEYVADRLHTYGTAFLGMTMECSRCHDHKYDPISAKDYYQLSAYFASIEEAGLYSYFTPAVPTPTLWIPDESQEKALAEASQAIKEGEDALASHLAEAIITRSGQTTIPTPAAAFDFNQPAGQEIPNLIPGGEPAKSTANNQSVAVGNSEENFALRLTGDDAVTLPVGNFTRDQAFSIGLRINSPQSYPRAVIFSRSKAWTDAASRGYEMLIEEGKLSIGLIHFYPGNAIRVRSVDPLPTDRWQHVTFTYDGSSKAAGIRLYLDGEEIETEVVHDSLTREITGGGSDTIVIGQRMRDNGFKQGLVDDFAVFATRLTDAEVRSLASGQQQVEHDRETWITRRDPSFAELAEELSKRREKRSEIVKGIKEIMTMRERDDPRQSYLLARGTYDNRADPVEPLTPDWLHPYPDDAPANRLGLAQWTTDPANPLTARVTVNRYWQMLFGIGLVSTSEDFGSQGRLPTHPDLLDWLARDFVANGWDLNRLLKQIVLSATYRQSSKIASGELASHDPENTLLYRYPAARLTAEMLRDNALAVSGLLDRTVGGAPVKPYDIAVSFKPSEISTGSALHRRSLYTYWRQTAPAPMMTTLDASKRDVCRVRQERTNSPLQGLVMLNSPQFVEASRHLAAQLVDKHQDDDQAIVKEAFRRLVTRAPDQAEEEILGQLLTEQDSLFRDDPSAASELLAVGDSSAHEPADPSRVAAVTVLVSALFNFDESITKR
ncbi:MAG: DUF1553 domain-containing protein, partial [Verrucomicrobiota bacterium]